MKPSLQWLDVGIVQSFQLHNTDPNTLLIAMDKEYSESLFEEDGDYKPPSSARVSLQRCCVQGDTILRNLGFLAIISFRQSSDQSLTNCRDFH